MTEGDALTRILERDRLIVLIGLVGITALAWAYLLVSAGVQGEMAGTGEMMRLRPWRAVDAALMFAMWTIMMVGMMVPSAAPMILLYARVCRHRGAERGLLAHTGAFLGGYLAVWTGFSLVATALQWALERAALLSPMMVSTSPVLGAAILIAAGLYQLTPQKNACLTHCRSPVEFLSRHWKKGAAGAFRMGVEHGAFCVGCCWALMALLFVGGVMNLLVVAAITVFVLLEKVAGFGAAAGRLSGGLLLAVGCSLIATGTTA